jgi:putative DNA primase/helicase
MSRNRKKSSRGKEVGLRSWKKAWQAETATFDEAKSLRARVVKSLQKGGEKERETARVVGRCRRAKRCGSTECPVCVRRRRRKAQRKRLTHTTPQMAHQSASTVILKRASDITPGNIKWLWPGRIALGKLSVIAGDPKLGKSQLAAFLAATVSIGGKWPCHEGAAPLGTVIILSAEDDAGDTVIPRLEVANANLSRIHFVDINTVDNACRPLDLMADAQILEQEIRRFADVRLVVIDPITAFLKSTSVQRAAAARLQRLAENSGAAVVVISHLAKTASRSALTQVMGSLGLVAVARALLIVVREKETDRRLFLAAENNFANTRAGLAFKIEPKTTSVGTQVSAVVWDGPVTISADEALASVSGGTKLQPALADAKDFLRLLLADGPVPVKSVRREAADAGISWASLRRAAESLGVKSRRIGGIAGQGCWIWELPDGSDPARGNTRVLTDARLVPSSAE